MSLTRIHWGYEQATQDALQGSDVCSEVHLHVYWTVSDILFLFEDALRLR